MDYGDDAVCICLNCAYYNPKRCSTNGYCYRVRPCSCYVRRTLISDNDSCKLFTSMAQVTSIAQSMKSVYETEPAKVRY